MKTYRFLPVFLTLASLFVVVSCRDDNSILQPKPNKQRNARAVGNSDYYNWQSNLTWTQQNWINQQTDPEDFAYTLWNDEMLIHADLDSKNFSTDITTDYPLYCYQVALAGAYHVSSIGATKAQQWIQMTYIDGIGYGTETLYNFNQGKYVAESNPTANFGDAVYNYMFINGSRYKIPGEIYVGTYNAVPMYTAPYLQFGSFALPGLNRWDGRIYFQVGYENDQDITRHEFGHILQGEDFGLICFYTQVVPASLESAAKNGQNGYLHKCYATETDANRRSYSLLHLQYPYAVWNESLYPFTCPNYDSSEPCP